MSSRTAAAMEQPITTDTATTRRPDGSASRRRMVDLLRDDPVTSVAGLELDHGHDHVGNRTLDYLVARTHKISTALRVPHPYFLFLDGATAATGILALAVGLGSDTVSAVRLLALWVLVILGYEGFLGIKARLSGEKSRHYVRDLTFYWVPAFVLGAVVVGIDWRFALGYAGLHLALWCGIVRLGCFVAGCCFGRPCRSVGVLYGREQLFASDRPGRRFRPGPFLARRVFPLQLVEAGVNLGLFAGLWMALPPEAFGSAAFFVYMLLYAPYRFLAEYGRGDRVRSHGFTRTQKLLSAHFVLALALLWLGLA